MTIIFLLFTQIFPNNNASTANLPCEVAYKREIVNTNSHRIDLTPQYFFSFTHPELKSFYKFNNFINAHCQLSKNDGVLRLNVNIRLSSSVARENYGVISTQNSMSLKLIKSGQIDLRCVKGSTGLADDTQNHTVYALSFELDKSQIKKLKKYEIDKVGVEWSSGYEEYEVYEVDALMNQLSCLEKLGLL